MSLFSRNARGTPGNADRRMFYGPGMGGSACKIHLLSLEAIMINMTIQIFAARFALALIQGALIGLERQWRHRMAGTRTNALVAGGAAAFAMAGGLIVRDLTAEARIVSYIVSGVGFLGAGVIFKESAQIRGLNKAATIWCSAAVGVVTALGYAPYAAIIMAGVLLANTALRPLAYKLHPPISDQTPPEVCYHLEFICRSQDESRLRSVQRPPILMRLTMLTRDTKSLLRAAS